MRLKLCAASLAGTLVLAGVSFGAGSYTEDFDVDPTAQWTTNDSGAGTNTADFFFDYNTVGIPPAPHSNGTTRGLRLRANIGTPPTGLVLPGISVSPIGQSFTGDYELKFDWWHNYLGPLDDELTVAGQTNLSTFGILTSGNAANYPGASDAVFFAATGDGGSPADFRIYSSERNISYQLPPIDPVDTHAFYPAGSRGANAPLYQAPFPAGAEAPPVQQAMFPSQTGATVAGSTGFRWHEVSIEKKGTLVSWTVNGVLLGTVETSMFTVPTGGTNILFGHCDVNFTTGNHPDFAQLQFTLIDNVRVVPEPGTLAMCVFGLAGLWVRRI